MPKEDATRQRGVKSEVMSPCRRAAWGANTSWLARRVEEATRVLRTSRGGKVLTGHSAEKVKERIVEYLRCAAREKIKGTILA